jgi:hypothetical protein
MTANQRIDRMTRSAISQRFQWGATGALLVIGHPFRSANGQAL